VFLERGVTPPGRTELNLSSDHAEPTAVIGVQLASNRVTRKQCKTRQFDPPQHLLPNVNMFATAYRQQGAL